MSTFILKRLIAVMMIPRSMKLRAGYVGSIINACIVFTTITFPTGLLALAQSALDDFKKAQEAMANRTAGNKAARDQAWETLYLLMLRILNVVQEAADANPKDAETYITTCLFKVKTVTGRQKQTDSAKNTKVQGTISVTGEIKDKPDAHDWKMSEDGTTFTMLPTTVKATTTVENQQAGTILYFQHRAIYKEGVGAWGAVFSVVVI